YLLGAHRDPDRAFHRVLSGRGLSSELLRAKPEQAVLSGHYPAQARQVEKGVSRQAEGVEVASSAVSVWPVTPAMLWPRLYGHRGSLSQPCSSPASAQEQRGRTDTLKFCQKHHLDRSVLGASCAFSPSVCTVCRPLILISRNSNNGPR